MVVAGVSDWLCRRRGGRVGVGEGTHSGVNFLARRTMVVSKELSTCFFFLYLMLLMDGEFWRPSLCILSIRSSYRAPPCLFPPAFRYME